MVKSTSCSGGEAQGGEPARLQCPFCHSYDVSRMYVASAGVDSCACAACRAHWDEERRTGRFQGRSDDASVLLRDAG